MADGAEMVGTLRRKKNAHGMFEDAWKTKAPPPRPAAAPPQRPRMPQTLTARRRGARAQVVCWLAGRTLHVRAVTSGGKEPSAPEEFDLAEWAPEHAGASKKLSLRPRSPHAPVLPPPPPAARRPPPARPRAAPGALSVVGGVGRGAVRARS